MYMLHIVSAMLEHPFVTHGRVEAFDVGILSWLARLSIFELQAISVLRGPPTVNTIRNLTLPDFMR